MKYNLQFEAQREVSSVRIILVVKDYLGQMTARMLEQLHLRTQVYYQ